MPLPAVHFVEIENTEIVFYNKRKSIGNPFNNESDEALSHTAIGTSSNANTTIHVTGCRGSSLKLERSAQQLRIHRSIGLRVEMMKNAIANTNDRHHHPPMDSVTTLPSCDWKPGTIILEASKDIVFSVPPMGESTPANRLQQEREQTVPPSTTATTIKSYWHQVVVKDFQWLRKGIASPNFQIEVTTVNSDDCEKVGNSIEDSTEIRGRTSNILPHQNLKDDELESSNSSDSEDEL
jgi:hypothetical protein